MQRCLQLLNTIQSRMDAVEFLEPVDWKGLGLDDYPKIVKHPMDLGTVESKLYDGKYKTIQAFAKDMRLVWENTMAYNIEESEIYATAESLLEFFDKKFEGIEEFVTRKKEKESKEETPAPPRKKSKVRTSEKKPEKEEKKSEKKQEKKKSEKKSKTPTHDTAKWKECEEILKSIMSKPEAEDFLYPVDWESAGLHDYPKLIKKPMDLGTVETKLQQKKYKTIEAYADDVRLVWKNAMTYNIEDSDIHQTAKKFLEMFEKKFKKLNKSIVSDEVKIKKEKQKFCDILRGIESNQKLASLVLMTQKLCPSAMEMKQGKEIVIQISKLDSTTIEKLMKAATED